MSDQPSIPPAEAPVPPLPSVDPTFVLTGVVANAQPKGVNSKSLGTATPGPTFTAEIDVKPPSRWWERSATKAAIMATVLGIFDVLSLYKDGSHPIASDWIQFGKAMATLWLSAWLGVTAAGPSKAAR